MPTIVEKLVAFHSSQLRLRAFAVLARATVEFGLEDGGQVFAGAEAGEVGHFGPVRLGEGPGGRVLLPPASPNPFRGATTLVFKMTDPVSSVTTYWDLLTRLWDREFVESHSTTSDYLKDGASGWIGRWRRSP